MEYRHQIPAHVPQGLVKPFDFFSDPGFLDDPFAVLASTRNGPPIFYTPIHYMKPGSWVMTRARDIRRVLQDPILFSSNNYINFSAALGEAWRLAPIEMDPPLHGIYRNFLNPYFSPKKMLEMQPEIDRAASQLIGRISVQSGCELIADFARPFPVSMFLSIMKLPLDDVDMLVSWAKGTLAAHDPALALSSVRAITEFMRAEIRSRRKVPRDDMITDMMSLEIEGRAIDDEELLGTCFLLFVAGLDTVTNTLGFHFDFLARNPKVQSLLRAEPKRISTAVEELLRLYSIAQVQRVATKDVDFEGVAIRQGDWITLSMGQAATDPEVNRCPHTFDLERQSRQHIAFSEGPHRCLGVHLARRELNSALNAFLAIIPPFSLAPGTRMQTHGGAVFGSDRLDLAW